MSLVGDAKIILEHLLFTETLCVYIYIFFYLVSIICWTPLYKATAIDRNFYRYRQVPFNKSSWSLDPQDSRDCKYFPLSAGSRYVQVSFRGGFSCNCRYFHHHVIIRKKSSFFFCQIWILVCLAVNPLNPELNPICYLLALLAHHFLHVSRIRVKSLTLRLLMSYTYIYGAPILDVSRSHTTTQHSR